MEFTNHIIEYLIKKAGRNYIYTVRNLIPLVTRDAIDFETVFEISKSHEPMTFEGSVVQILLLRLFPDKVPLHYALFLREAGLQEVSDLSSLVIGRYKRSDFKDLANLVGHSQIELRQNEERSLSAA